MPLVYERDDVKRRVVVTATGPFHGADLFAFLARQRDDGTWTYGLLFDTCSMAGHPTIEDVRVLMKLHADTDAGQLQRGPLALLATGANVYGMASMCAALGGTKRRVQVFSDRDEAVRWLAVETGERLA
jgi:hypothetical protein